MRTGPGIFRSKCPHRTSHSFNGDTSSSLSMSDFSYKKQGDIHLKNAKWMEAVKAYTSALAQPGETSAFDAIVLGNRR